ncbi:MAG: NAD(P)H-hydrate dehydratase [Pseudomonadota bacterium]
MIELLTPTEMGRADALAIESGIPGYTLMKKAGLAVADEIAARHPLKTRIVILCGPGNNGGDGLVAARILVQRGYPVRVFLVGRAETLSGDAAKAMTDCPVPAEPMGDGAATAEWHQAVRVAGCIVDALFGAGLSKPITGPLAAIIEEVNASEAEILSVDLPSGVRGVDGRTEGAAIRANRTVTFFRKKPGHCLLPGMGLCGLVRVADIGIPDWVLTSIGPTIVENRPAFWLKHWAPPEPAGHKYTRGHCFALSGPLSQTGAIRLAARAALRSGAGLVTILAPASAMMVHAAHATAVMTKGYRQLEDLETVLADERITSIVVGPGLGLDPTRVEFNRTQVRTVLETKAHVVLDADALTLFADDPTALLSAISNRKARTFLTPHEGEFRRLFPDLPEADAASKLDRVRAAAEASGGIILLKGADTVIGEPGGRAVISHAGSPWLATAGSGDVLAGILAGLMARYGPNADPVPALETAALAAHLHNEAARHAGPGLIAEDLVEGIRPAVADLAADFRERTAKTVDPSRTLGTPK